jgi:hypothetical protein
MLRPTRRRLRPLAALVVFALAALPLAGVGCHRTSDGDAITPPSDPKSPKDPTKDAAGPAKKGKEPASHRALAVACAPGPTKGDVTPPPAPSASAGAAKVAPPPAPDECSKDADCKEGKNGRCAMTGGGRMRPRPGCVYDKCFADADCGAKSECVCGSTGVGNHCRPGTCATDADCGSSYCSPSYGTSCGPYGGYHGNYCHTADDECTSDDDCPLKGSERGYCAWYPEASRWKCGYNHCVG